MAGWTLYGRQQMLAYASGALVMGPADGLYLALYSDSADPASAPTELAVSNYMRQLTRFSVVSAGVVGSQFDVSFANLGAGTYLGYSIIDDIAAGGVWWWADAGAPITIPGGSDVDFAAGSITASV